MSDVYQSVGLGDLLRVVELAASDVDLAEWAAKL